MSRNLSIVECFDAVAAKEYLRRSRVEFIVWLVSFAVLSAIAICLFSIYGVNTVIHNRIILLWFGICFGVIGVGGLTGSIVSICRYKQAERTVLDSGAYIQEVASLRADAAMQELLMGLDGVLFKSEGFYFNDIDSPYLLRQIGDNTYSSNYQVSVVYVDGNTLRFKSVVFSLLSTEERIINGDVPFDKITGIGIIKANGIDLFCSQLKVVFGAQCMLFALNSHGDDYFDQYAALRKAVYGVDA